MSIHNFIDLLLIFFVASLIITYLDNNGEE